MAKSPGDDARNVVEFSSPSITDDDVAAVVEVLESGWLTTGAKCIELERALEKATGAAHAVAVSSCTTALEIALAYVDPAPGVVVVPTWTFASTGLAPHRVGARTALVDVDPATLNISPTALEFALGAHDVRAVIPVHIGGVPVDREIHELCADAGVPVIEDAAHALGATDHRGAIRGSDSVGACLSFYATKNLTCGEGGALLTSDDHVADFARSYRLHGLDRDAWARYGPGGRPTYELLHPGIKANLPDVLAALALSQLQRFAEMQRHRRTMVETYRAALAGLDGVRPLPGELVAGSADHLFMIELDPPIDRAAVVARLDAAGVRTSVHFRPLHTYRWFAETALRPAAGFPVADCMADRVLSLPLHPNLTADDVERIGSVLADVT